MNATMQMLAPGAFMLSDAPMLAAQQDSPADKTSAVHCARFVRMTMETKPI